MAKKKEPDTKPAEAQEELVEEAEAETAEETVDENEAKLVELEDKLAAEKDKYMTITASAPPTKSSRFTTTPPPRRSPSFCR